MKAGKGPTANSRATATASTRTSLDGAARLRIVDSTMALLADRGVDDISLRELTAHAGVNLAAVNYHFGSKDALVQSVFEDLSKRVNRKRLDRLRSLLSDAKSENRSVRLEDVLTSFMEPYIGAEDNPEGKVLAQLILRHRHSPTDTTSILMRKHFDPMAKKYIAALATACPEIPRAEFYWRYTFMVSTVVLTITDRHKDNRLVNLSAGTADPADAKALRQALMRFLIGAMRASAK